MQGLISTAVGRTLAAVLSAGVLAGVAATVAHGSSHTASSNHHKRVCGLDIVWLQTSAEGDVFEIRGGRIALHKSHNQQVRKLASTLIKDHTKSLRETKMLAHKLGVDVPSTPSPSERWELEEVAEMRGAEFNHDYSELEVLDHIQDIQEAMDEVELGCNNQVQALAKQDIPMLKYHLHLAREALRASGPEPSHS
jgi:putative membrane protein